MQPPTGHAKVVALVIEMVTDTVSLEADTAILTQERDGYRRAYEQLNAEVGTLRSEREGYKRAYEQLNAEVGTLRAERDGYKNAFETIEPRYNHLRMVAAPVVRENLAPSQADKPSIFVVTLPKSGTMFIGHSLRETLGYDYTGVLVTPTFPKNIVWQAMARDFARGGMVSVSHMQPDAENLAVLKEAGIRKCLLHVRDPRAALASWYHFLADFGTNRDRVVLGSNDDFWELPKSRQMDRYIDAFYKPCIDWLSAWVEIAESNCNLDILVKSHDQLASREHDYLTSVLDFFGLAAPVRIIAKSRDTHYRQGDNESWRSDLTREQIERVNALLPQSLAERFGWSC